jgi:hypothetical protein
MHRTLPYVPFIRESAGFSRNHCIQIQLANLTTLLSRWKEAFTSEECLVSVFTYFHFAGLRYIDFAQPSNPFSFHDRQFVRRSRAKA